MASPARRAPAKAARSAIPQLSWRTPQPAPIVLVSGPEEVCAERAIAGRYGEALIALRHALASGADPVPLVAAVAMKLRTMARVAGNREPSAALAARLGMKDWQVDRARRDLMGWNEESLGRAIQATARADAEVKGGSRDAVLALERMITVIATRAPYGA